MSRKTIQSLENEITMLNGKIYGKEKSIEYWKNECEKARAQLNPAMELLKYYMKIE